jgi:uncharacterized protein YjdB
VVAVTGVSVAPSTVTLSLNGSSQLTSTIIPSNATNKAVTWSSNNTAVATVSTTGLVTGRGAGSAVISCTTTDGGKVATASVTVSGSQAASIDLDNAMRGTGTNQFNFVGSGWTHSTNTADPYFNKTVSFSNAANNSATVTFSGNKIELYAAKASHHGVVAISIDNGPETLVDQYSASRQDLVLAYGSAVLSQGTHTIRMRVTGSKNAAATGSYVILDYLKVYSSGSTTAVSSISISPATVTLAVNATSQLSKSILPLTASNQNVSWSSSNTAVATVSTTGLISAISSGTATITAKTIDGGKTATASVTVTTPSNTADLDNNNRGTEVNQFAFSGSGWTHAVNTVDPYYQRTVSFSNVANHYATVNFVGNKVEMYSAKASHHGIVAVSIDNGPERNIDLYAAGRENNALVYSSDQLTQGSHTIKIRVTGSKHASATGAYAILDYLKVYSTAVGGGGGTSAPEAASIMMEESSQPLEYYPNPLREGETLHVNVPEASGEVTLLDLAGVPQRTFTVTDTSIQIPTSGLLKGIYLLQYRTTKGREVVKIMVQ